MERLNKEIILHLSDSINIKYGSVNKNNPKVIYIVGKTWIYQNNEYSNPNNIKTIMSLFKQDIIKSLLEKKIFSDKILFDYDINLDFTKKNKFMTFEIFLKQNSDQKKTIKKLETDIYYTIYNPIQSLIFNFNKNNFTLNLKKSK